MQNRKHDIGKLLALVALAGLVLQGFVTIRSAAAMPHGPVLDAFGNPLCLTWHGREGVPTLPTHGGMQDCCSLGCGPSAAPVGMPPEGRAAPASPLPGESPIAATRFQPPVAKSGYEPGNPRAPPHQV